jgi:hypothetical protein
MSDSPNPTPIRRRFRVFLAIAAFYVLLLALIPLGYPQPFMVALIAGSVIGLTAMVIWQFLSLFRKRPTTEEEFEAQYHSRQQLKSHMVQIADEVYHQAPIGKWQARDVSYFECDNPKVHEEKALELTPDGRGTYLFINHDLDVKCQTTFQFKPAAPGQILVHLTSPISHDWTPVAFGFDMQNNAGGTEQLVLWLEADSPLPDDQQMHWPFNERFTRAD